MHLQHKLSCRAECLQLITKLHYLHAYKCHKCWSDLSIFHGWYTVWVMCTWINWLVLLYYKDSGSLYWHINWKLIQNNFNFMWREVLYQTSCQDSQTNCYKMYSMGKWGEQEITSPVLAIHYSQNVNHNQKLNSVNMWILMAGCIACQWLYLRPTPFKPTLPHSFGRQLVECIRDLICASVCYPNNCVLGCEYWNHISQAGRR